MFYLTGRSAISFYTSQCLWGQKVELKSHITEVLSPADKKGAAEDSALLGGATSGTSCESCLEPDDGRGDGVSSACTGSS